MQPFWEAIWEYIGMFRMCILDDPAILPLSTYPGESKDVPILLSVVAGRDNPLLFYAI